MNRLHLLAALLVSLILTVSSTAQPKESDQKGLVGKWKVVAMEHGGKAIPADSDMLKMVIELTKDKLTVIVPKGDKEVADYKVDVSNKLPHLDVQTDNGKILAIYELKGDSLKICFDHDGGERPTKFATSKGTEQRFLTLTRIKK